MSKQNFDLIFDFQPIQQNDNYSMKTVGEYDYLNLLTPRIQVKDNSMFSFMNAFDVWVN